MISKIKNTIKENIKLDFKKFEKQFYNAYLGYSAALLLLYIFLIIIYYGGLLFLPLLIFCYFDSMLDKNQSNQKFVKIYNWIQWTTLFFLLFYAIYVI